MHQIPPGASLQGLVVRPILRAIFSGQLAGGTRLIEQEIASRLKMSRAPVREALRDLSALGLVELRPNQGALVNPFNPESVRGIFRVRLALECEAASLAAGNIPMAEIRACEGIFEDLLINREKTSGWSERAIGSDEKFHALIAQHCGLKRLAMEIGRYNSLVGEIRQALGERFRFQQEAIEQHLKILHALAAGDSAGAAWEMRQHIASATERAVEALFGDVVAPSK